MLFGWIVCMPYDFISHSMQESITKQFLLQLKRNVLPAILASIACYYADQFFSTGELTLGFEPSIRNLEIYVLRIAGRVLLLWIIFAVYHTIRERYFKRILMRR